MTPQTVGNVTIRQAVALIRADQEARTADDPVCPLVGGRKGAGRR